MPRRKHVDIELDGLPKLLGAEVYQESPGFICLLPNDVHENVVGRGASVAEAVDNWDVKLQAHLRNAGDDDTVVIYVKGFLAKKAYIEEQNSKPKAARRNATRPTWDKSNKPQHVIDFENQFYSSRRTSKR